MIDDFGPDFDEEGNAARGGRVRPRCAERPRAQAPEGRPARTTRPRTSRGGADKRGRRERRGGAPHSHPEGSQEPHLLASRTSTRSRGRWRWSPRRACAAPSSGSTRMRPYAQAIRKMTRQVAEAAAGTVPRIPLLEERENTETSRDPARHRRPRPGRRLQHPDHPRGAAAQARASPGRDRRSSFSVVGRRGNSTMQFRGEDVSRLLRGLHRPPGVRRRARDLARPDPGVHRRRRSTASTSSTTATSRR